MKKYGILCILWVSILLSSCAYSTQPLSDANHPLFDHRLKGLWAAQSEEEGVYLHIGVDDENRTQIVFIEHNDKGHLDAKFFSMHPTAVDGEYYGNLMDLDNSGCAVATDQKKYIFLKYKVTEADELVVEIINHKAIATAIESGMLAGEFKERKIPSGDPAGGKDPFVMVARYTQITDSPEKIIQFIRSSDPEVLFDKSFTFKRIGPGL